MIPVAEVEALQCVRSGCSLSRSSAGAALGTAGRPAAATGSELSPFPWRERSEKSLVRMWHFDKRINSGALPHCTAEVSEFTNVSLLYLKH